MDTLEKGKSKSKSKGKEESMELAKIDKLERTFLKMSEEQGRLCSEFYKLDFSSYSKQKLKEKLTERLNILNSWKESKERKEVINLLNQVDTEVTTFFWEMFIRKEKDEDLKYEAQRAKRQIKLMKGLLASYEEEEENLLHQITLL